MFMIIAAPNYENDEGAFHLKYLIIQTELMASLMTRTYTTNSKIHLECLKKT